MKTIIKSLTVVFGTVTIIGVSYYIGAFSSSFDNNLCYSGVIDSISSKAIMAIKGKDQSELAKLEEMLSRFPMRGYETNCNEIKLVINKYYNNEKT